MFTKKIVALLVFTLVIFISTASELNAQEEPKTLRVDAKQTMVDTGIKLEKGDVVKVTNISGTIKVNSGDTTGKSYEGNKNTVKSSDYFEFGNAAEHALVMWVGSKGNHSQVRKNIATEVNADGNLFFALNDGKGRYSDNSGGFDVTYKIVKSGKVCSPPTSEKVDIKWVNKTGKPIRVNWINFKCQEETSDRLIAPNGIFDGYTFVGHVFRVRDESKNDIGLITVESSSSNIDIVK